MFGAALPRIEQFLTQDRVKQLHYQCLLITLMLTPLSTSLSNIAYFILSLSAIYQISTQHLWLKLLQHPITRVFWSGALLVVLGMLYASADISIRLLVAKKYLWLFITPLLLLSYDKSLRREQLEQPYSIYLMVITLMVLTAYARIFIFSDSSTPFYDKLHLNNVFKDHIVQSLLFSIGYAIGLYRLVHTKDIYQRLCYAVICLLIIANLLLTNEGRTGYLLILLFTFYTVTSQFKRAVLPCLLSLLILIPLFYFSPTINQRWHALIDNFYTYQSAEQVRTPLSSRVLNWEIGLNLFKEKPLIGYGTGGIFPAKAAYLDKHHIDFLHRDKLFDSSYLNFLVQYGVLGIAFCLYFLIALWRSSIQLTPFSQFLARTLLLSLMSILWINPWLSSTTPSHLFSLLFALLYNDRVKSTPN